MNETTPTPAYTVFSYYHSNLVHGAEDREGNETILPWMISPNKARRSIDGLLGIVTGIYQFDGAEHITQEEAEALMATPEWTAEESL